MGLELYYSPKPPKDGLLVITGQEARHIARVMRHAVGDKMAVTDGSGTEFEVELTGVKADRVEGKVLASRTGMREAKHRLVLAQAMLKGDKLVQICEQVTELGVAEIVPLETRRTVGRLSPAKMRRLQSAALAALKSSTRTMLPRIGEPITFEQLLALAKEFDHVLVAYEEETGPGLGRALNRDAGSVLVVVGPEGGFEPEEIARLKQAGAVSFTLGPRRLRAETAAVAVAALTLGLLGDLG
jgi:16S rRNA (uracil1498-N3)-methyltransferase